jgi:hypothetical protein
VCCELILYEEYFTIFDDCIIPAVRPIFYKYPAEPLDFLRANDRRRICRILHAMLKK